MQFAFTQEQTLIRETARDFFNDHGTSNRVRAALETQVGYDESLWCELALELGWAGIAIPEQYGGSGLGMVELAILMHEQGRRLVPSPFFSTVCLASPLIACIANEAQRQMWLSRIAAGQTRIAAAITGVQGISGIAGITAELRRDGSGFRLNGQSGFVIYGHACDALLVAARSPGTVGPRGVSCVLIDPHRAGITIEKLTLLDLTRPMSRIRFEDVAIDPLEILGEPEHAAGDFDYALDLARIALCAEALGGAEWTLEMTTHFAKERRQFGRPIGSFQAIKHRLADMMVRVEGAKSAAWYAACVANELDSELAEAAAIGKAACCDAFVNCASNTIQLHGGIGFTWEHDAHLYFKRARATSTLLGSPTWHRERLAKIIGLGEPAFEPVH